MPATESTPIGPSSDFKNSRVSSLISNSAKTTQLATEAGVVLLTSNSGVVEHEGHDLFVIS